MKTNEIRQAFLNYFKAKGHMLVPSSSLVPADDPTLFFTNAGMVPWKQVFLGGKKPPCSRVASAQCCMRVSGKHNDLEQVGFTARHHTFFEMLGNFSFGDYFKREAIKYAWDFLTVELKLPSEKLWVTVYEEDNEAANIWLQEIGVAETRFSRCGAKDNFWSMGDIGPCGPCSEIFYDHGEEFAGFPPGSGKEEGERYVEIWNLVFMQYERNAKGELTPLPKPAIDTGMGLERLAAVMQGVHDNYAIDIFKSLIQEIAKLAYVEDLNLPALRVIADHIRASVFLIAAGITPSNEGRGYVLRRIIRRAILYGNKLGLQRPFLYMLVDTVINLMSDAYPHLHKEQILIKKQLLHEEEQFAKTLQHGLKILAENMAQLETKILPGLLAFKLYDTYGFPLDLTVMVAQEKGFVVDEIGFATEMEQQRARSQHASQFHAATASMLTFTQATEFLGYERLTATTKVIALLQENSAVDKLSTKVEGAVVLSSTPFYAESGGQIGDCGQIKTDAGLFIVHDTKKIQDAIVHLGVVQRGEIKLDTVAEAIVDVETRHAICLNHTATHLLHAALRQILGKHVKQQGSLVTANKLRFDFSHEKPMTHQEITQVEQMVYAQILANCLIETGEMTLAEAIKLGAMALFGEKYGERVRVLHIPEFSVELCGGTHAERTGDLGFFKIITETGVAAGIRRIEAVTGWGASTVIAQQEQHACMEQAEWQQQKREYEKTITQLKSKLAHNCSDVLLKQVKQIEDIAVLAVRVDGLDVKGMRDLLDQLKNKLQKAVIVLATVGENKAVDLIAGVTKNCLAKFHADDLIKIIADAVGGKGGGRPDMAQGGGNKPDKLENALNLVAKWVQVGLK